MNDEGNIPSGDEALGMDRDIPRRDFLNGLAIAVGGSTLAGSVLPSLAQAAQRFPQDIPGYYPPTLTGCAAALRGRTNPLMRYAMAPSGRRWGRPKTRASATT